MSRSWWLLCLARMVMGCSSPSSGPGRGHPEPLYNCRRPQWPGTTDRASGPADNTGTSTGHQLTPSWTALTRVLAWCLFVCVLSWDRWSDNLSLIFIHQMIASDGWWLTVVWSQVIPRQSSVLRWPGPHSWYFLSLSRVSDLISMNVFWARHETDWRENFPNKNILTHK